MKKYILMALLICVSIPVASAGDDLNTVKQLQAFELQKANAGIQREAARRIKTLFDSLNENARKTVLSYAKIFLGYDDTGLSLDQHLAIVANTGEVKSTEELHRLELFAHSLK